MSASPPPLPEFEDPPISEVAFTASGTTSIPERFLQQPYEKHSRGFVDSVICSLAPPAENTAEKQRVRQQMLARNWHDDAISSELGSFCQKSHLIAGLIDLS